MATAVVVAETTARKTRRMTSGLRQASLLALVAVYVVCMRATVTMAQELDMDAILAASPAPSPTAGGNATGFNLFRSLLFSILSICFTYSFLSFGFGHPK